MSVKKVTARSRPWKGIALPVEHGSWGLTLEPVILGLLVAPTIAGLFLAIAAVGVFLARQPYRVWQLERNRGNHGLRRKTALKYLSIYTSISLVGFTAAWLAANEPFLAPIIIAVPFGAVFFYYDTKRESRSWQAELAAPVAFSAVTASIALLGGWSIGTALALWAVMVARSIPSVMYVRARLRLDKGKGNPQITAVVGTHLLAFVVIGALVWIQQLPALTLAAFLALALRAVVCLSENRQALSVKTIGFIEVGLGALTVLLVAVGFYI